jgi:hypothetical protein
VDPQAHNTVTVDTDQSLWKLYGFRTIPNGFFMDSTGICAI